MAAVRIDSREVFQEVLAEARAATAALAASVPGWELCELIDAQLAFMAEETAGGAVPAREDQLATNLGPLAVKNLEESHPAYATLLKELDYAFRRYGALP